MLRRICLLSVTIILGACATPALGPVTDTASAQAELSTFSQLIQRSGLTDTLRSSGSFTVFAPSDAAFKAMPAKALEELQAKPEALRSLLSFHVLPTKLTVAEARNTEAKTLLGANVALSKSGSFMTVEDAVVQKPDLGASNGVVHVIDRVLTPPKR